MTRAYIGLGSNLGQRKRNILSAWNTLTGTINNYAEILSSPYLSEPVGIHSECWFINAVGIMTTDLGPARLLTGMLAIETAMGRDRSQGEDRIIDLDLLYYDDVIIEEESLTIPHPAIADRLFVLQPLVEIAPDRRHPVSELTSREMREELDSEERVEKTSWDQE